MHSLLFFQVHFKWDLKIIYCFKSPHKHIPPALFRRVFLKEDECYEVTLLSLRICMFIKSWVEGKVQGYLNPIIIGVHTNTQE
jgi:hypothetical protein